MIQSVLLKRCYDSIKAHFYINELERQGIYAFLHNEHVTDLIPFGDGGYLIHVEVERFAEAVEIIKEIEANEKREPEFHNATHEDIEYEKLKTERKATKAKNHTVTMIILVALIALILLTYLLKGSIIY